MQISACQKSMDKSVVSRGRTRMDKSVMSNMTRHQFLVGESVLHVICLIASKNYSLEINLITFK